MPPRTTLGVVVVALPAWVIQWNSDMTGRAERFTHPWRYPPPGLAYMGAPLLPTAAKANALGRFLERRTAALLWHPMKTGGTTTCEMAVRNYMFTKKHKKAHGPMRMGRNCRADDEAQEALVMEPPGGETGVAAAEALVRDTGRYFFALEPSYRQMNGSEKLSWIETWRPPRPDDPGAASFWDSWVHVLLLRDPVERFYSQLHSHGGAKAKHLLVADTCRALGASKSDDCVQMMVKHKDLLVRFNPEAESVLHAYFGNSFIQHLTGTDGDLARAKSTLRKFSLILDWKGRPRETLGLLEKVLGWHKGQGDPLLGHGFGKFKNTRITGRTPLRDVHQWTYLDVARALEKDIELYRYGLSLMDEHAARLGVGALPAQELEVPKVADN